MSSEIALVFMMYDIWTGIYDISSMDHKILSLINTWREPSLSLYLNLSQGKVDLNNT